MATTLTPALRDEYARRFASLVPRSDRLQQIRRRAAKIVETEAKQRYQAVEAATGVPWFVVGIIHSLEADLNFRSHLHNGDSLQRQTVHVPRNRPGNLKAGEPPFTWQRSAIDALVVDENLNQWSDWSLPGIAFVFERYNGFGYRRNHPEVLSPYLWSFGNHYLRGKYVEDGSFSADAVSQQCGGMLLMQQLIADDQSIAARVGTVPVPQPQDDEGARPTPHPVRDDDGAVATATAPADAPFAGRVLSRDANNEFEQVKILQRRLVALGCDPGMIDGDFGAKTEQAVRLFQSRTADASSTPLEIDGVVGPVTWRALFPGAPQEETHSSPLATAFMQALIDLADDEIGVREQPLGSNRGPRVDQYIRSCGLDPAEGSFPWCVCFVYFCVQETTRKLQVENLMPRNPSVVRCWTAATTGPNRNRLQFVTAEQARTRPDLVRPGMMFFIDHGGGTGHAGLVASVADGRINTIEGNTNDNGSREGIGVFRRTARRISQINLGFIGFDPTQGATLVAGPLPGGVGPLGGAPISGGPAGAGPQILGFMPAGGGVFSPVAAAAVTVPKTWVYQLQDIVPAQICGSDGELAVVDYSSDGSDAEAFTAAAVSLMKQRPSGAPNKKVVAYMSIGEAEKGRFYWPNGSMDASSRPPGLGPLNPNFPDNFKVKYWNPDWQKIILGTNGYLERILRAGFDGVYLDIIDGFEFWEDDKSPGNDATPAERAKARDEMVAFVTRISQKGKQSGRPFMVIPQNGEALLRRPDFLSAIDAIGKEDIFYGRDQDFKRNRAEDIRTVLEDLDFARQRGMPVYAVEYLQESMTTRRNRAVSDMHREGLVPFLSRDRDLKVLEPTIQAALIA
ncbi:MAG: MJ1477/TM1410 family putative glycoside hydrolase [Hyphomicrobiaceae bacterium]